MTTPSRYEIAALTFLLLTYLVIGALYAAQTPAWQVPDEPAHYNYIAQLHTRGCCPVMQMGDYDQMYLEALTASKFDPAVTGRLGAVQYEDHQPPLYYLLAWPVFAATSGDLTPLRLFSVALGGGVALIAWATIRALFPTRPWFALTAAGFTAFVPQHVAMMAGVNNDSLAELWIGGVLLASVLTVRGGENGLPTPPPALLGALVGLAGLTKTTAYFTLAVALAAAWLRWRRESPRTSPRLRRTIAPAPLSIDGEEEARAREKPKSLSPSHGKGDLGGEVERRAGRPLRSLLIVLLWVILVAAAINAPWWLRNAGVYGGLDIAALGRHDAVVVGQPRTDDWVAEHGPGGLLRRFVQFTFNSFWGQFGWMAVPMPDWIYAALLVFTGVVIAGLVLAVTRNRQTGEEITAGQRDGVALLALTLSLTVLMYIYYNLTFVQHQGRYLFPALIPLGFGVALGLDGWIRPLGGRFRWPLWVRWIAPAAVWIGFAALDVYALLRVAAPAL